ncbi:MAG: protein translocase subunit SecF [Candidatus Uhrbacteria bacterium]|nr:protein translocase subunit SecF [Patescibacteria group bacterium]MBU1907127.1 protein translocase subunit SecF [Patescibacteria group bacterium]
MNIVGLRNIWFLISGGLTVASIVAVAILGLNFGIDFTGGSLMEVAFETETSVDQVRSALDQAGYPSARVQPSNEGDYLIRLEPIDEQEHQAALESLKQRLGEAEELRFDMIGPVIGNELRSKALWAIGFALLLIMTYIAWAFRKVSEPVASWKYGLLTIVAATHDLIIPIGVFAVLGHVLGYQIDTAFVAALLTILGYSINDTIVVFDRTRENLTRLSTSETFESVVNCSINQTLTRSVNTSITTLLALLAVFFFGGETIQHFALALIIGILCGTYSSIFLASPLLVSWERFGKK